MEMVVSNFRRCSELNYVFAGLHNAGEHTMLCQFRVTFLVFIQTSP